ncbi:CGNR zinc finger protein [Paenibacillus taihuensis]|uniref:CGNR zinc finger protein n=1 Tax=Paenibacillus taihuensis TaxID=1156355 RepID=A0A3D9QVS8_9BACL|nr:CGNR zinc finger domain-containing protein [Paenibacillus taihuensis]REE67336.1 CGNR zinc finger protein [Paenibacillus taihuensis]
MEQTLNTHTLISFLNTWDIPNDERVPQDKFTCQASLEKYVANYMVITRNDLLEDVVKFRSDLRRQVEFGGVDKLNHWIKLRRIGCWAILHNGMPELNFGPDSVTENVNEESWDSIIDMILVLVLRLLKEERFHRVKICPDCKYAFYDESRSSTKKWCSMTKKSPEGRACGTIAKVKRFREKQKN